MQSCRQDYMALRNEDRDWISAQIRDTPSELVDTLTPHGARRVAHWLREWGLVAAAEATPLTLLGLLITVCIFAASGLTKNAEFRTHTEDRLNAIEKDVSSIKGSLNDILPLFRETTIKRLREVENLTPKQLSEQLPELKLLARTAKAENIPVKPETVETLAKRSLRLEGRTRGIPP